MCAQLEFVDIGDLAVPTIVADANASEHTFHAKSKDQIRDSRRTR